MKKLYFNYLSSFEGLSREVWWLALITLINRAGTMVIPFLSLYLTQDLQMGLKEVGIIMSSFGLGSLVGSWLGGKLTDLVGYYPIMLCSLFLTGVLFIGIQFIHSFWWLCGGIFILMVIADAFRPASFVALSAYSKPENKTRSVTLIRLAINLGFSAGPAVGGLLIGSVGYSGLFWIDGGTCIMAAFLLLVVFHPKKAKVLDNIINNNPKSAYTDLPYMLFLGAMMLYGFIFLQYFSTVPLFYKDFHSLSESQIGLLLGTNGFLIFVFEMPLIKYMEVKSWSKVTNIILGLLLVILSFLVLNLTSWTAIVIYGMLLMTLGEMIAFPFSNAFAMERAKRGRQGEYLALYSIAFSISHVFGHNLGMVSIDKYGYQITWYVATAIGFLGILLLLALRMKLKKK